MERTGRRPLKIGVQMPIVEERGASSAVGPAPRWTELLAMARRAEALGFDSLWVPDHLLFRRPEEDDRPAGVWEGWSLLAALAATTDRIGLGTLVVCTAFRNPALLAKMAATVDEVSGGRLVLGLGAGWHEPEFRAFGVPFDHRVDRFEEAIRIIRTLLREGRIDFEGAYSSARDCELRPRAARRAAGPAGPPIMVGTTGERMLRLTARYADVWNAGLVGGRSRPDAVPPLRAKVDAACAAVGRDPTTLRRTVNPLVCFPELGVGPVPSGAEPLTGSAEGLAEEFRGFAREGIAEVQVLLSPHTMPALEALGSVLAVLDRG